MRMERLSTLAGPTEYETAFGSTAQRVPGTNRPRLLTSSCLEEVGEQGGHSSKSSRQDLQQKYENKYKGQRKRIREMKVRGVAIEDQKVQAVFEIYAILALGTTKYNSFQTT